jgi:succinyl-CoA synthetase alpha subunit
MAKRLLIRPSAYFDSVFLMQAARRMSREPGVRDAAAVMGTEQNRKLLVEAGYAPEQLAAASPNDLIVAIDGEDAAVGRLLADPQRWFHKDHADGNGSAARTLEEALTRRNDASLAVISVPGEYAAAEARKALAHGLNVFLFSSDVSVEDELTLKHEARAKSLIVMGPDCGTALIGGAKIGFANAVRRGSIGVVGPTGTGIQELTCLVHQGGAGISHAIGTGSRDLSDAIGGISTLSAFEALEDDDQTKTIVLLSKPPGRQTMQRIGERLADSRKPVVACLFGTNPGSLSSSGEETGLVRFVPTVDQAASVALTSVGLKAPAFLQPELGEMQRRAAGTAARMTRGQHYLRGLFAGGTFCYQSQSIMRQRGLVVYSNAPLDSMRELADPEQSREHSLIDMGAEMFVAGRPHPMIDATLRRQRIVREAADPQIAVLLLDFILGTLSSADPVGDLLDAIVAAKKDVSHRGGELCVVASVCGTEEDEQRLGDQVRYLETAGVLVFQSNAQAASFSREVVLQMQLRREASRDKKAR